MVQMHYREVTHLPQHRGPDGCGRELIVIPERGQNTMKRIIGAIVAGVVAFSGIYALAATLNLGSAPTLGAATQAVAACTSDTLTVSYPTPAYSASLPGYTVSGVTVTDGAATPNLATACGGHAYSITVSNSADTSLATVTGTVPASGNSFTTTFTSPVDASQVANVAVTIS